jgi:hypothetical protein
MVVAPKRAVASYDPGYEVAVAVTLATPDASVAGSVPDSVAPGL